MILAEFSVFLIAVPSLLGGLAAVFFLAKRGKRTKPEPSGKCEGAYETFDERLLVDVERIFEDLLARGVLVGQAASAEDRARARIPAHAGAVFRALAGRFRSIELAQVGVTVVLHDGEVALDAIGGWRFKGTPEEIDVRLAPQECAGNEATSSHASPNASLGASPNASLGASLGASDDWNNTSGDVVLDTTWSPRSSHQVVRHSTILHFLVRSAVGDGE